MTTKQSSATMSVMPNSMFPVMSAAFLHTVIDALRVVGCPDDEMARQLSLTAEQLFDGATALPANRVYSFLAWAAERSGDHFFSLNCGRRMGQGSWAPIVSLFRASHTVSEFLQKFIVLTSRQGATASYRLEVDGLFAIWRLIRPKGANPDSCQADAVAAGFFCELLKQASDKDWKPDDIVLVLSNSDLIPASFLPSTSVIGGADRFSLRFPSEMLNLELGASRERQHPDPILPIPTRELVIADRVAEILRFHLSNTKFGVDDVAELLGMKRWRLQALLAEENTSVSTLRNDARRELALQFLLESEDPIGSIAKDLGYAHQANFTRAVRGWTGISAQAYRAKYRK